MCGFQRILHITFIQFCVDNSYRVWYYFVYSNILNFLQSIYLFLYYAWSMDDICIHDSCLMYDIKALAITIFICTLYISNQIEVFVSSNNIFNHFLHEGMDT